jgi:hypothetical protein
VKYQRYVFPVVIVNSDMVMIEENNFLFSGVKGATPKNELKRSRNKKTRDPKNVNVCLDCVVIF